MTRLDMNGPKKSLNRPKKRTLVRWDDDLDELLLLTVQSVCNKNSIKIPWAEVATTMGHNVSEGAIVQHLAKVRLRRLVAGKDVPPPLRRGGIGTIRKSSNAAMAKNRVGGIHRLRSVMDSGSPTDLPDAVQTSDNLSDEDYVQTRHVKVQTGRTRNKCNMVLRKEDQKIKQEPDSEQDESDENSEDSGVMVAPGARFLHYRGNSTLKGSTPLTNAGPRKRKIVILKYKPQSRSMGKPPQNQQPATQLTVEQQSLIEQSVSVEAVRQDTVNIVDPLYQPPHVQYLGQHCLEVNNANTMNMAATQNNVGSYTLSNNNFDLELPRAAPEDLMSSFLDFPSNQDPTPDSFTDLLTNPHDELMRFNFEGPSQLDIHMEDSWNWMQGNGHQQDTPDAFLGALYRHGIP